MGVETMSKITSKTADRLARLACQLAAMADAIHEAGYTEISREVNNASYTVANAAGALDGDIAAYAKAALSETPPSRTAAPKARRISGNTGMNQDD